MFLNYRARRYLKLATPRNSINYFLLQSSIRELFDIAASEGIESLQRDGQE
ncbi:MAG: hypothetical protein JWQ98_3550 [Chlorobi bacterium]|nr:hypothetical protein [Chlorobiota bacterium]